MNNADLAYGDSNQRQHAYDPKQHPALFDGILSRRVLAFLFDAVMIVALMAVMSVVIAFVGVNHLRAWVVALRLALSHHCVGICGPDPGRL